jgi:hypothetical protein
MTAVGNSASNGAFYTEQWYLAAPASGTNNIVVTVSGTTTKLGIAAISFTGVDQTTPIDVSGSTTGTSGTVTKSLTTTNANEYLLDAVTHLSANSPSSETGTVILNDVASGVSTGAQYASAATAGSNSMSWTYPDPGDAWAYSVLAPKVTNSSVNASIAQSAATLTATTGTQTLATVNYATVSQVAATLTVTGGSQGIQGIQDVALSQVAATITATTGTQSVAAIQDVAISQVTTTLTLTGGTQNTNIGLSQTAATLTASGGTQSITAHINTSVAQVAATLTVTGGAQGVVTLQDVSIAQTSQTLTLASGTQVTSVALAQSAATLSLSGGTQSTGVTIPQSTAALTLTGGTQSVATVNIVAISQVGATITATGGSQGIQDIQDVQITQTGAVLTLTDGTQTIATIQDVSISQTAATVTASGGTQAVVGSSGSLSAGINQVGVVLAITCGTPVITTSTGPLPKHKTSMIFLADGRIAVRLSDSVYLPL